jgi:hypothetical protein
MDIKLDSTLLRSNLLTFLQQAQHRAPDERFPAQRVEIDR